MDISFHYPPDLLNLLIEAIPRLCKSKQDLLTFFQGAGVEASLLRPHRVLLASNKDAFKKHAVARTLLIELNQRGERTLRERREILKRVTEFEDFSVCWENDQAPARGLVAQIRGLVDVKDSFTRMKRERESERRQRMTAEARRLKSEQERAAKIESVKTELFALFRETDAHKRGKALEGALNNLFAAYGILVREAFTVKGHSGEGVIEQIDGLVEFDGQLYLVEVKWWNSPIGIAEISPHLVRIYGRGGQVRGIFISYSEFTEPAISTCRQALAGGAVIILCKLEELIGLLSNTGDLRQWIQKKVTAAVADRNPYTTK